MQQVREINPEIFEADQIEIEREKRFSEERELGVKLLKLIKKQSTGILLRSLRRIKFLKKACSEDLKINLIELLQIEIDSLFIKSF